ncbi:TetR/AcrR family transcriptional regulator [Ferrovibrio sp.]|uniref:TetR/AcrR family transcriptional regulator n=1 Tax=Ferrovibrio sp. TaxID=1917215 RepID=UPI00351690F0
MARAAAVAPSGSPDAPRRRRGAASREKILAAAGRALRRDGPERLGVLPVMREAGLTHGGFYAHFASRDDLVAEAIRGIFAEGAAKFARRTAGLDGLAAIRTWIGGYVTPAHRDNAEGGCGMAALASDLARLPPQARAAFDEGLRGIAGRLASRLPQRPGFDAEAFAFALMAEMAGAVALSRSVSDRDFSDRILTAARTSLLARLDTLEPGQTA